MVGWNYFTEETLSDGTRVTVPFETEEEYKEYLKQVQNEQK